MTDIVALFPALARPLLESRLPVGIDARWFADPAEAAALAAEAEIAWLDASPASAARPAIEAATRLKWLSTLYAGLDTFPLDLLAERGVILTNGSGLNAFAVADYAVMGVLVSAKGFADVVRAHDRREWLAASPGTIELAGSRALVIGYGTIGAAIGERLKAFGVAVTGVRRTPDTTPGMIGPDDWRAVLSDQDWVVLAAPSTGETRAMIGAAELAAMKRSAWLINIARGDMIDQDALVEALAAKRIGGAFLDPTDPEPLPADHPLWTARNAIVTMHLSGRSQTSMFRNAADLLIDNLHRYLAGEPLRNRVDLSLGY